MRGILCQKTIQGSSRRRGFHGAPDEDILWAHPMSVQPPVIVVVLFQNGAIERNSGKQATRARVTEDFSMHLCVGGPFGRAPHRPRRGGYVGAQLDIIL